MKLTALTLLSLASVAVAAPLKRACFIDPATGKVFCTGGTSTIVAPSSARDDDKIEKRQSCMYDVHSTKGQCVGGMHATVGVVDSKPIWPKELGPAPKGWE